jgi:hypothetical protein
VCHCDGDADFWECAGARDNKMLSLGRKGLTCDVTTEEKLCTVAREQLPMSFVGEILDIG